MKKQRSSDLTACDRNDIDKVETSCKDKYDPEKDGGPFKVGDVCLKGWHSRFDDECVFSKNAVGALRKYRVVHVAPSGIFFLKEIDCRGRRISPKLYYPERLEYITKFGEDRSAFRHFDYWVLDPSQLDAILLGDDFDPNADGKERADLFTEVHAHNGVIRLDTSTMPAAERLLAQMKPGEIYWKSTKAYITVDSVTNNGFIAQATVTRSDSGKTLVLEPKDIMCKRFYRERPRSFWRETEQK